MSMDAAALGRAKEVLRERMRRMRVALPSAVRARAARALCDWLVREPWFVRAAVVAGYVPVRGELDPRPALAAARARGAVVVWPRVRGSWSEQLPRLMFLAAFDPSTFSVGRHGVPEPPPTAPEVPICAVDCFLVPGLAFDQKGNRLGQGGGYYDDLAGRLPARRAVLVGVGYDFQRVGAVPVGPGDATVDQVVTVATSVGVAARRPGAPRRRP